MDKNKTCIWLGCCKSKGGETYDFYINPRCLEKVASAWINTHIVDIKDVNVGRKAPAEDNPLKKVHTATPPFRKREGEYIYP